MKVPCELTPEQEHKLASIALRISLEAAERQNKWARSAYISWETINEIRTLAEEYGLGEFMARCRKNMKEGA